MISGFILFNTVSKEFIYGFGTIRPKAKFFAHYLLFRTSKISLDKYIMTIHLSLGKYQILLFAISTLLHSKVKSTLHV